MAAKILTFVPRGTRISGGADPPDCGMVQGVPYHIWTARAQLGDLCRCGQKILLADSALVALGGD